MKKILLLVAVIAIMVPQAIAGNYSLADFTVQELSENDSNVGVVPPYLDLQIKDAAGNNLPAIVRNTGNPLVFTAEPYIPVQYFNGTYTVETIPYSPADTSFRPGARRDIGDGTDVFSGANEIPFPFYFFGIRKNSYHFGSNGMITFCGEDGFAGSYSSYLHCPYELNSQLPWASNNNSPGGSNYFERMHDAIYGVYEDIDPDMGRTVDTTKGYFYDIRDEYPHRKLICSWNEMKTCRCSNNRNTYQIVCYEGTNIIEVHVKKRQACSIWQDGCGLIGIQNATGQPQEPDSGASTQQVVSGSPAAFWPAGYNLTRGNFYSKSFRFTPQGTRSFTANWYRIFDDGRPDLLIGTSQSDTNGYCVAVNPSDSQHPTLTSLTVNPSIASRYMLHVHILTADTSVSYDLYDTVEIAEPGALYVEPLSSNDTMGVVLGGGFYSEGSTARLMAAPFRGYAFNGWNNGVESNPYNLTVESDTTVTALFMHANVVIHDTVVNHDTVVIHDTIDVNPIMFDSLSQARVVHNNSVHNRTFIPDGVTMGSVISNYLAMPLLIEGYEDSSTITSAEDIHSVCVNMEHSWMSDVCISVVCPNGQEAFLKNAGGGFAGNIMPNYQNIVSVAGTGGNAFMGGPLSRGQWDANNQSQFRDSLQNPFGWGLTYCFSRHAGYTLVTGDDAGSVWSYTNKLPQGQFYITSEESYGNPYAYDDISFSSYQIPSYFLNQGGVTVSDTTIRTKRPSNRETKTDYYLPVNTLEQLVGCPVNGEWNLRVYDIFGRDNGWVFEWDIDIESMGYVTYIHDTIVIYDTLWLTPHDTVWLHDTIYVHDTTYVGIGEAEVLDAKVYSNNGQIVVEGAEGHEVMLFDVNGRMLATRRDDINPLRFDVPASGTYLIKIGRHAARKVVAIR